jgi:hypothetical protein
MNSSKVNIKTASILAVYALFSLVVSGMISYDVKALVFFPEPTPEKSITITSASNQSKAQTLAKPFIVFRMDDVQDYFSANGSIAAMDVFMKKKLPLLIGIEPAAIGNDSSVINKTKEAIKKGIVEVGLHGATDYRTMSLANQTYTMKAGNDKIFKLFGVHPKIFIPPTAVFNNDTLKALDANHMPIMSAIIFGEEDAKTEDQIFNKTKGCGNGNCNKPLHISATSQFRLIGPNTSQSLNNSFIENEADELAKNYGYVVLLFHNQDLMKADSKDNIGKDLSSDRVVQLSELVDDLVKKYRPVKMEELESAK